MIVKRTWERLRRNALGPTYQDIYTGWFLLGILPLYIVRERHRR